MRILITGGAGFIGSHLCERLLHAGHTVLVIDDLSTGSLHNLAAVRQHARLTVHVDSIFNRSLMAELVQQAEIVFHLAAAVGVRTIIEAPVRTIETNVGGTELLLELAAERDRRVVLTSTSEVYGKSNKLPFQEDDDLVLGSTYNARWSYACSKIIDEFLALAYFRERGLPATVVRLFNTVGPRQTGRYGMVLPRFVQQALHNEPITVYGTGEQTRCFSHVRDIVTGLVECALKQGTVGEIFNLGTTEEVSINALAARVRALTGSSSAIEHIPYREAYGPGFEDMARRVPDVRKAKQRFGFEARTRLDAIIRDVAEHMQREEAAEKATSAMTALASPAAEPLS
jgi:UDP-glucose 4-epimerase